MLFSLLGLSLDPLTLLITLLFEVGFLLIVLSVHEAAHAFMANRLGDSTARLNGRLTLNPLAHIDPIGGLMILLVGFGWGKPVPYNPLNLRSPRRDSALISFAGPGSNFLMALLLAVVFRVLSGDGVAGFILAQLVGLNLALGIFNLIPISPLDGFKVVSGLLPWRMAVDWEQTQRWGIYLLIILLVTPAFNTLVFGPVSFLSRLLLGV